MAKISLRAYNREIETLVERGQSEEAIAHCKFILKTYPKHLDTYRLIGKAFLESQRYSEAGDILLRILSVQPDDFVAQIGMSIIREDEGNLDAALFHMERAFEIQPSNAAIQDEMRRLYGRRDGVEPPKIRLTHGALVRMYARGDLYRQAIAEARSALAEDTQRLDLNIVLANMYFLIGQKAEAAEISSRLVAKLPFCYEANRILAEVLPETSRAVDAKIYQQRLLSLDPYLGYISETTPTIAQVPDQAVTIDRLELTPSLGINQQPAWAKSLGISIEAKEEENKTDDWLTSFSSQPEMIQQKFPAPQPLSEEIIQPSAQVSDQTATPVNEPQFIGEESEEIPNWMRSAGWAVTDHPVDKPPELAQAEPESLIGEDVEPAPADMPDWLKDLAPAAGPTSTTKPEEQDKLDWLASILPKEPNLSLENIESTQPTSVIPTVSAAPSQAFVSPVNEELPDWMRSGPISSDETANPSEISDEPLPDWLTESTELTEKSELFSSVGASESLPKEWLDIDQTQFLATSEPPISEPVVGIVPISTPLVEPELMSPDDLSNMDDELAWLKSLAVKHGADKESLLPKPEERQEQPPEWVGAVAQTTELEEKVTEASPFENEQIISAETAIPQPEDTGQPEQQLASAAAEPQDAIPSILAEVQPETEIAPSENVSKILLSEAIASEPIPTMESGEVLPEPEAALPPQIPPEELNPFEPASTDMDAAFAWLESLAVKQGADEASLLVSPEERLETLPDWVKEQSQETSDEKPAEAANEPADEEGIPEWMKSSEEAPVFPQEEIQHTQVMPDWLKALEASPDSTFEPLAVLPDVPTAHEETILPTEPASEAISADWIQEVREVNVQEALLSSVEDTAPVDKEKTVPVERISSSELEPFSSGSTGPLPRWLSTSSLHMNPPLPEPTIPDTEETTLPNWLQEEQPPTPAGDKSIPSEQPSSEAPPLPEWLQNIEPEKVDVPLPETPMVPSTPIPSDVVISSDPAEMIKQAQIALAGGQIDLALNVYNALVQQDQQTEETIHDLRDALYRFPVESSIWQTLGDALIRANRVQDALDAYTKAEELLK